MMNNENKKLSRLANDFSRIKAEISTVIEKGRDRGLKSEIIVDNILKTVIDEKIVVEEGKRTERPVNIKEIVLIAKKAVEQAEFEGVSIVLTTGVRIKNRKNHIFEC